VKRVVVTAAVMTAAIAWSAAPAVPQRAPVHADSTLHDPEPSAAPLIVPGRPLPAEGGKTRQQRAQEYLALGREMEQQGQPISAVAAYRNAIQFDTTLTGVALRIGQILASLGDDATAVQMFATEVSRNPGDRVAAREFGLALSRVGQHELALRQLEMLVRRTPNSDEAWSALGIGRLSAGRAASAESALRRAIALPPARAVEHRDLGAALAAQGKVEAARASYRRAIQQDGKDAAVWLNLGNLEREAGRKDDALAAYREAEKRDSSFSASIAAQARLLGDLGRTREAGEAFRRWVMRSPNDLGARLEAVEHFLSEGRTDVATEIARDAMRRDRRSPDAHLMLGVTLDVSGNKREALAELRRAERLFMTEAGRQRARGLIEKLRASAPDSLRELFTADSVQAAKAAAKK
jgi:tetratricopeptide (TPR) repeat protein